MPPASPSSGMRSRERRTVIGGMIVAVVGLLLAYAVLPFARRWSAREATLSELRIEADSLSGLVSAAARIEAAAAAEEAQLAAMPRRVFHARSAPLAASALQSLLQDAADASHLLVTRLEVAQDVAFDTASTNGPSTPAALGARVGVAATVRRGAVSLPATLAANCDIIGLAALLDALARAPRVVYVERLTVQQTSALRGAPDMLQIRVGLRAPVVIE